VVGSIMLVGITVLMAGGFGLLLFAFDGPVALARAEVSATVDAGTGGWGTGDETVRLFHRGGDPLSAESTVVMIEVAGVVQRLQGTTQLGSVFGDGRLTIGETWQRAMTIQQGQPVNVRVASDLGAGSNLVTDASTVASQTVSTQPCVADSLAPSLVQWGQSPGLITALTTGPITVSGQLSDNCWGVDQGIAVRLRWQTGPCLPVPATTLANFVNMTTSGINTWTAAIPAQSWAGLVNQCLHYQMTPIADLGGNMGSTPVRSVQVLSDCSSDITPPTVSTVTQTPADVRSNTLGSVAVSLVLTDDCSGVDLGVAPHLWYRLNDGSSPPFIDAEPSGMTLTSGVWSASISGITWAAHVGKTLEYYFAGFQDANGNAGTTSSTPRQDIIDLLATYTYPTANTVTTGSLTSFANLQSATDSGAEATLTEAAFASSPTTQVFNANSVLNSNGWSSASPTRLGASDDTYASFNSPSPTTANNLQVGLANPSVSTGAITQVILSAEVSIVGHANDGFRLQACLSGSCTAHSGMAGGSSTDSTITLDITTLKPGAVGEAWTWTDITNLEGVVDLVQQGTRDGTWRVDRVWADVTFVQTTYTMAVQLDWTTVPTLGLTPTLDLRYRTTGDSFNVQVCTWTLGTCTAYNTRGAVLSSASATVWQYALTASEVSSGRVSIRFVDATPGGTSQGTLALDYARVYTL
jgi:hypothetical protein